MGGVVMVIVALGWHLLQDRSQPPVAIFDLSNQKKPITAAQVRKTFLPDPLVKNNLTTNPSNVDSFCERLEGRKRGSHRVYLTGDTVVAEEYLFECQSIPLLHESFVNDHVPSNLSWSETQIQVVEGMPMMLVQAPLFTAKFSGHIAKLYKSLDMGRLVIVSLDAKTMNIDTLVQDAKLPSKAIQDALRQAERMLEAKKPEKSN